MGKVGAEVDAEARRPYQVKEVLLTIALLTIVLQLQAYYKCIMEMEGLVLACSEDVDGINLHLQ